ncbi:putative acetyl-hydrolase LipR [Aspergillus udagawae]|nr:putative acetyl-hydrolase LipR [Aspergillus udagawae]GFG19842.1 putative acetyl-hydrolase LipR [Aspergillus udagawae]
MGTNPSSNNANEPDTRASLVETLGALEKILRFVEKYKVAALVILALAYPKLAASCGWKGSDASSAESLFSVPLFVAMVLLVAASQSTNVSWQLRYAYLEWQPLTTWLDGFTGGHTITLVLITLFFFPVLWLGILGLISWQLILLKYRQYVRKVTADMSELRAQAKIALDRSQEYATAASEYEWRVLKVVKEIYLVQTQITEVFDRQPGAFNLLAQNVESAVQAGKDLTDLTKDILVGLSKAEDEFGKVQQLADKVTTLAEHGEIVDAASSAVAIQERLTAVHEAENSLLRIKEGTHSIMVKVYLDDMLATQKKLLEELQARAREREEQAEEDAQPILDNTVTLTNPIAIVGSLRGAVENIDDRWYPLELPFAVSLFNHSTNNIFVTDNGILSLDSAGGTNREQRTGQVLPFYDQIPAYSMFPFWTDLKICEGKPHGIYYEIVGEPGSRSLTVEWYVTRFSKEDQYFHFNLRIDEAHPNTVTYQYYDAVDKGAECTIGVQGADGGGFAFSISLFLVCRLMHGPTDALFASV